MFTPEPQQNVSIAAVRAPCVRPVLNDTVEVNPPYIVPSLSLTLLHSEWPKLHRVFAVLSAIGLKNKS